MDTFLDHVGVASAPFFIKDVFPAPLTCLPDNPIVWYPMAGLLCIVLFPRQPNQGPSGFYLVLWLVKYIQQDLIRLLGVQPGHSSNMPIATGHHCAVSQWPSFASQTSFAAFPNSCNIAPNKLVQISHILGIANPCQGYSQMHLHPTIEIVLI